MTCPLIQKTDYRWPGAATPRENFGMTRPAAALRP
jgi:hypothetical protein